MTIWLAAHSLLTPLTLFQWCDTGQGRGWGGFRNCVEYLGQITGQSVISGHTRGGVILARMLGLCLLRQDGAVGRRGGEGGHGGWEGHCGCGGCLRAGWPLLLSWRDTSGRRELSSQGEAHHTSSDTTFIGLQLQCFQFQFNGLQGIVRSLRPLLD